MMKCRIVRRERGSSRLATVSEERAKVESDVDVDAIGMFDVWEGTIYAQYARLH